jgi:hypothetical protein
MVITHFYPYPKHPDCVSVVTDRLHYAGANEMIALCMFMADGACKSETETLMEAAYTSYKQSSDEEPKGNHSLAHSFTLHNWLITAHSCAQYFAILFTFCYYHILLRYLLQYPCICLFFAIRQREGLGGEEVQYQERVPVHRPDAGQH